MKVHLRCWIVCLALLGTAHLMAQAQPDKAKKYALLVGINRYQHDKLPDLRYAVNDARRLGAVLSKAGFAVTVLSDETGKDDPKKQPTRENIERSMDAILKKCQRGDIVVIGLAGHGLQFEKKDKDDKDDAYFCPQDARPFRNQTATLVSLKKVYERLEQSFAGMKVLLVDACRDDPDADRGVRGVNADAAPRPPLGVAALFSCRAGEKAFENPKLEHGFFFYHIIKGLEGEAQDRSQGRGVVKDDQEAIRWFRRSAELGNSSAINALGRCFEEGWGIAKDHAEAARHYRKSADRGYALAMRNLGWMYQRGTGVGKDYQEAVSWFRKATEHGAPAGMQSLGRCYENGWGVERDNEKAVLWYRKAAELGETLAMRNLADLYADGRGVTKDPVESRKWLRRAADLGDTAASRTLARAELVYVPVGTLTVGKVEQTCRDQALDKLCDLIASAKRRGYQLTSARIAGTVLEKDNVYYLLLTDAAFQAGKKYVVVASGDNDVLDLDLKIRTGDGTLVGEDSKTDPTAQVELGPGLDGRHYIYLRLYGSRKDLPCVCTVAILESK